MTKQQKILLLLLVGVAVVSGIIVQNATDNKTSDKTVTETSGLDLYSFKGKVLSVNTDVMLTQYEDEPTEDRAVFTYEETRSPKKIVIGDLIKVFTFQNPAHSKQVLAERIEVE
jgi:hypothetical protein